MNRLPGQEPSGKAFAVSWDMPTTIGGFTIFNPGRNMRESVASLKSYRYHKATPDARQSHESSYA